MAHRRRTRHTPKLRRPQIAKRHSGHGGSSSKSSKSWPVTALIPSRLNTVRSWRAGKQIVSRFARRRTQRTLIVAGFVLVIAGIFLLLGLGIR